ncbi:NINE protein [Aliterella atlantica]|uniref:Membrane protein n=1 Tax=Aliterella atlantica CENA595 TaxID=1618023 RepID=A0A0D8ZXM0_9CYAN|nr:NINE protein [Aliterella atlantica]KJH73518.1 membrane protein [Aliterella atlantica CENA595]
MLDKPKSRKIAAVLALTGTLIPIAGLHKFYLGQPIWGLVYLLLSWTPIPHAASAIEGVWYLLQDECEFDSNFNGEELPQQKYSPAIAAKNNVSAMAEALRQLDCLREDGLISEYEFEQKRRQMLERIS